MNLLARQRLNLLKRRLFAFPFVVLCAVLLMGLACSQAALAQETPRASLLKPQPVLPSTPLFSSRAQPQKPLGIPAQKPQPLHQLGYPQALGRPAVGFPKQTTQQPFPYPGQRPRTGLATFGEIQVDDLLGDMGLLEEDTTNQDDLLGDDSLLGDDVLGDDVLGDDNLSGGDSLLGLESLDADAASDLLSEETPTAPTAPTAPIPQSTAEAATSGLDDQLLGDDDLLVDPGTSALPVQTGDPRYSIEDFQSAPNANRPDSGASTDLMPEAASPQEPEDISAFALPADLAPRSTGPAPLGQLPRQHRRHHRDKPLRPQSRKP